MLFIGIDLGTSGVKLLLTDEAGNILRNVLKKYEVFYPRDGWSEQRPEDWWEATRSGVNELISGIDASKVAGISFGGQMHGLVILDKDDRVIRPAIIWNDGRTNEEVRYLNDTIGKSVLSSLTGNIAFAGFTAPKLLWLRKHEPENFKAISKIMLPKDYIAYKMTGVHSTDYSDASGTLLLDVAHKCWSKKMLEICGVDESLLPALYESYEVTGTLTRESARCLGLPQSVRVCAGAGDNAAAAIGTDTIANGKCSISVGTSGTVFIACDSFYLPENNAIHSFAHADGRYHLMGCILSAASCSKWWIEDVLRTEDYAHEQTEAVKLGTNSVFFAPYLMGERSPYNDTDVRGAFLGLSANTSRGQMTQAVMEGVAFAFRDIISLVTEMGIDVKTARLCGGGSKSPLFVSIITNILNIPIEVAESEGPAFGAAILASVGCGAYASPENALKIIQKSNKIVYPTGDIADCYNKRYESYKKLYSMVSCLEGS